MIGVIANCKIDSQERFLRFIDSYNSLKKIEFQEWNINIRGAYSKKAIEFLKDSLTPGTYNLSSFECRSGWINTTKKISRNVKSNFLFYWVEDHILVCSEDSFKKVFYEFKKSNADWLSYSWFNEKYQNSYMSSSSITFGSLIDVVHIDQNTVVGINNKNGGYCYTSCLTGLFTRSFFNTVLNCKRPKLLRWPHNTPFDFEKIWEDGLANQINIAIPKLELLASIDDDMGQDGYSLISRGKYPKRIEMDLLKIKEGRSNKLIYGIKNLVKKNIYLYIFLTKNYIKLRRMKYTIIFHLYNIFKN
jgi:hypothetical protein